MDGIDRPRVKLVGVIAHGRKRVVYVVPPAQKHGANMTCTILNDVILTLQKESDMRPQHLWVQMDNCSGENKNNTVMAYGALLQQQGVFKTVRIGSLPADASKRLMQVSFGFLPVGHTHEDIDGFHSRHSLKLRRRA